MSTPKLFHISIHSDRTVYTTQYKKVISNHALYIQNNLGRKHGKTLPATYVLNKLGEALMDSGAVPLVMDRNRGRFSTKPMTFFVTQLDGYWEAAIADLAKVGVRIYVLPVLGSIEGIPDSAEDSFNAYYAEKLKNIAEAAERGADVRDVLEVTLSLASQFEDADIHLKDRHRELIDRALACYKEVPKDAASDEPRPPEPDNQPALQPASVEDDF